MPYVLFPTVDKQRTS